MFLKIIKLKYCFFLYFGHFRKTKNIFWSDRGPATTCPYRLPYSGGFVQRRGRQERGNVPREPDACDVTSVADELHFEVDLVVQ